MTTHRSGTPATKAKSNTKAELMHLALAAIRHFGKNGGTFVSGTVPATYVDPSRHGPPARYGDFKFTFQGAALMLETAGFHGPFGTVATIQRIHDNEAEAAAFFDRMQRAPREYQEKYAEDQREAWRETNLPLSDGRFTTRPLTRLPDPPPWGSPSRLSARKP